MQDKHQQVTQVQVDLWLDNPVTQALYECLGLMAEDIKMEMSNGSCVDSSNADMTSSQIHLRLGHIQSLDNASRFHDVLTRYESIEVEESNVKAIG